MARITPLQALLRAYDDQVRRLRENAKEYEGSNPAVAADFLIRARELQARIESIQRQFPDERADTSGIS